MTNGGSWAVAAAALFAVGGAFQLGGAPPVMWWTLYLACYLTGGWEPALAGLQALRERTLDVDLLMIVAALVAGRREPLLHGAVLHQVHLVRFAPPVIELRPEPDAPRDLAPRLAALLLDATGTRWTIALSRDAGYPTLADQGEAADQARRGVASEHPLVRAILDAFPGAKISRVTDSRADAYGLVDAPEVLGGGDGREFAPLDAEEAGMMEDDT